MATNKELEAELAQARRDIDALASLAAERTGARVNGIAHGIEAAIGDLSAEARQAFDSARSEGARARQKVEEEVRSHPFATAGIAFGLGALLMLLLSRR
ncbi:DUF883 family protein [Rhodobacterales bacterium HKCCE3408]|nr:DUF883 family protein [Rhodobacterales bacterium HKCCE3408]